MTLFAQMGEIKQCNLSTDGRRIAALGSTSGRRDNGQIKIWDTETGRELVNVSDVTTVGLVFLPDWSGMISVSNSTVKMWDSRTGEDLLQLPNASWPLAVSADGKKIVAEAKDSSKLRVWDLRTGTVVARPVGGSIGQCIFSPDGRRILSSGSGRLCDAETGRELMDSSQNPSVGSSAI